jgi:hypothetical protein
VSLLADWAKRAADKHDKDTGSPFKPRKKPLKVLIKTQAGQTEMMLRQRGLSQRHRTMLILVDGKRTYQQVLDLAAQVGVPKAYLDELRELGLVTIAVTHHGRSKLPVRSAAVPEPRPSIWQGEAYPLPGDDDTIGMGLALTNSEMAALDVSDTVISQARSCMLQALRLQAPIMGAVTMLRVRRARHASALRALLTEVHGKIGGAHERSEAALLLRRALTLLA